MSKSADLGSGFEENEEITSDNVQRLVEEGRAFFCSELVAKCWKVCGVMKPTEEACSNYFPVHFTTSKQTI